ncbi:MAG: Gfo/Idh/MocA family oxidoreductase [Chloroflexota bacterium]
MADKIRWGIISTANIGRKAVIPAIHASSNGEVVAVASRNIERAQEFADANGIPKTFGSYEDMLASGEVDAVYNPLPNDGHGPWSKKAADAGIAVLCEKPLTLNAEEAQETIDYIADKGVLFAEAFMYRFHPQHDVVRDTIGSGDIGDIRMISSTFTYYLSRTEDIRLLPELGGGGLMDVGCYCINAMRLLTGEEPDGGQAFARYHPETNVDIGASCTLSFPSGAMGHFDCGMEAYNTRTYDVRGTKGRIRLEDAFLPHKDEDQTVRVWRGEQYEEINVPAANQYQLMVEDFADALINNRPFRFPVQDAVGNMMVIENLMASAQGQDGYWY